MIIEMRHATASWPALLEINNANARETSLLDAEKFARMIRTASVALSVLPDAAFLLAFAPNDAYDGRHFTWFCEHHSNFLYVDRIVVDRRRRRVGLGRVLYNELFARARTLGVASVACEVNAVPPNPVSDAFHAAQGFVEVGRATLDDGAKTVRYLMCKV